MKHENENTEQGNHDLPTPGKIINEVMDPYAELGIAAIIPKRDRIAEFRETAKSLDWCSPDSDICESEESLEVLVHKVKQLGLSINDIVATDKSDQLTILPYLYRRLYTCPHLNSKEKVEFIYNLVKDYGLRKVGCTTLRETPTLYYDRTKHIFWQKATDGKWQSIPKGAAEDLLALSGLSGQQEFGGFPSEIDRHLVNVISSQGVDVALSLAGYDTGLHTINRQKVLVTETFELIRPVKGSWSTIKAIIERLLGEEQALYFYLTQKIFYEALRDGRSQPGQMMVFCGPPDSCKSLLQHRIITPVWGQRSADAARYLMGKTEFNSDLFGAEHLFLDDAKPYGNYLTCYEFSENLKSIIVGQALSYHAKGRPAMTMPPRWRLTMTLNSDEESMRSLPDFTASFADKAHLFHCQQAELPMPNDSPEERAAFEAQIQSELPAYIHFLVNLEIPEAMRGTRFGVKTYHNLALLEKMDSMSDENILETLIDRILFRDRDNVWEGRAVELKLELTKDHFFGDEARNLLRKNNSTGMFLGRLAKKNSTKYTSVTRKIDGKSTRIWRIEPPSRITPYN